MISHTTVSPPPTAYSISRDYHRTYVRPLTGASSSIRYAPENSVQFRNTIAESLRRDRLNYDDIRRSSKTKDPSDRAGIASNPYPTLYTMCLLLLYESNPTPHRSICIYRELSVVGDERWLRLGDPWDLISPCCIPCNNQLPQHSRPTICPSPSQTTHRVFFALSPAEIRSCQRLRNSCGRIVSHPFVTTLG